MALEEYDNSMRVEIEEVERAAAEAADRKRAERRMLRETARDGTIQVLRLEMAEAETAAARAANAAAVAELRAKRAAEAAADAEMWADREEIRATALKAAATAAEEALKLQAAGLAPRNDDQEWTALIEAMRHAKRSTFNRKASEVTTVLANGLTWVLFYERRLSGSGGDIYVTDPRDGEVIRSIVGLERKLRLAVPRPPGRAPNDSRGEPMKWDSSFGEFVSFNEQPSRRPPTEEQSKATLAPGMAAPELTQQLPLLLQPAPTSTAIAADFEPTHRSYTTLPGAPATSNASASTSEVQTNQSATDMTDVTDMLDVTSEVQTAESGGDDDVVMTVPEGEVEDEGAASGEGEAEVSKEREAASEDEGDFDCIELADEGEEGVGDEEDGVEDEVADEGGSEDEGGGTPLQSDDEGVAAVVDEAAGSIDAAGSSGTRRKSSRHAEAENAAPKMSKKELAAQ